MPVQLDPVLLEVLACPAEHHAPLRLGSPDDPDAQALTCTECGRVFPVRDGIPGIAAGRGHRRSRRRSGGRDPMTRPRGTRHPSRAGARCCRPGRDAARGRGGRRPGALRSRRRPGTPAARPSEGHGRGRRQCPGGCRLPDGTDRARRAGPDPGCSHRCRRGLVRSTSSSYSPPGPTTSGLLRRPPSPAAAAPSRWSGAPSTDRSPTLRDRR